MYAILAIDQPVELLLLGGEFLVSLLQVALPRRFLAEQLFWGRARPVVPWVGGGYLAGEALVYLLGELVPQRLLILLGQPRPPPGDAAVAGVRRPRPAQ